MPKRSRRIRRAPIARHWDVAAPNRLGNMLGDIPSKTRAGLDFTNLFALGMPAEDMATLPTKRSRRMQAQRRKTRRTRKRRRR